MTTTPVCEGAKATIHLTGLVPNTAGSATYTHPLLSGTQTATGTSDANGEFEFQTPELPLAANNTVATLTGITITASGCTQAFNSPVTLLVNPAVSVGTVTGSSTLCIGRTANFASTGTSGGTWSSSDPTVATVSGVGVVTALTAGSTDIIYTVSSGCGSPKTSMQSLTVSVPAELTSIPTTGTMTVVSGSNDIIAGCAYIGKITNASFAGTNSPDMTLATSSGPYGSRKYTLTPSSGSANTADIVLYFGQDDFNTFNIGSSVDLPTGPLDTQGMVNLRIKHTGSSTESIDPLTADIQWNSAKSWWEISFSVTHFSTFELEAVASPLPVTLTSFNAVAREQTALLNWATTFETNSQNFEVQHSQNGKVWKTLGSVDSKGESRQLVSYQYLHTQPGNGENLYRRRMVDRDGTFAYSRITSLTFELDEATIIYPNPVADIVRINVRDWSNVKRVRIISLNGGTVYDSDIQNLSRTIDVKSVLPGLYVVEVVRNNGHTNATKVTISR